MKRFVLSLVLVGLISLSLQLPKASAAQPTRRQFLCQMLLASGAAVVSTATPGCAAFSGLLSPSNADPFSIVFKIQWAAAGLLANLNPLRSLEKTVLKVVLNSESLSDADSVKKLLESSPQSIISQFLGEDIVVPDDLGNELEQLIESNCSLKNSQVFDPLGIANNPSLQNKFANSTLKNSFALLAMSATKHAFMLSVQKPTAFIQESFINHVLLGLADYFVSTGYTTFDENILQSPAVIATILNNKNGKDSQEIRYLKPVVSALLSSGLLNSTLTFIHDSVKIIVDVSAKKQFNGLVDDYNFLKTKVQDPANLKAAKAMRLLNSIAQSTETQVFSAVESAIPGFVSEKTGDKIIVATSTYAASVARVLVEREFLKLYRQIEME